MRLPVALDLRNISLLSSPMTREVLPSGPDPPKLAPITKVCRKMHSSGRPQICNCAFSSQKCGRNAARVYETYWDTEWELSLPPPPNPVITFHSIPKQRFSRFRADMILEMVQLERIRSLFSAKIVMSRRQKESEWVTLCVSSDLVLLRGPGGSFVLCFFIFTLLLPGRCPGPISLASQK